MNDFTWAELGERVRDLRIAKGMTQQELAERAALTQPGLARVEAGHTNPQLETIQRLAAALDCSVRSLFTGVDGDQTKRLQPVLDRVLHVFESRDQAAIETFYNALVTAETLLRRGRKLPGGRSRTNDEDEGAHRRQEIEKLTGWKIDIAKAERATSSKAPRYQVFPAKPKSQGLMHVNAKLVQRARRPFRKEE